ncbi:MAG: SMC family ATPase, partial [Bacilli bacterium]|nr:SMC family ATPase [Bacilli bacterium]
MRPVYLEISAFGPYKDLVKINFDELKNPLFLINGPTGSGKTTIFDAICYALYGVCSGKFRQAASVRSDFADEKTETYVLLKFTYLGKLYEIKRWPARLDKENVKNGGLGKSAGVVLKGPDFDPITKIPEAKKKVAEIIGLDNSQFMSSMMVAQGDFNKLITEDTDNRKALFSKILNTYFLRSFIEELNKKASDREKELVNSLNLITGQLKSFAFVDQDSANAYLGQSTFIPELLKMAEDSIAKQEKDVIVLKEKFEEIGKKKDAMTLEQNKIRQDNANRRNYEQNSGKLHELEALGEKINALKEIIKRFKDSEAVLANFRAYKDAADRLKRDEQDLEENKALCPSIEKFIEEKKALLNEKEPTLSEEIRRLTGENANLSKLFETFDMIEQVQKEVDRLSIILLDKSRLHEKLVKEIEEKKKAIKALEEKINSYQENNSLSVAKETKVKLEERARRLKDASTSYGDIEKGRRIVEEAKKEFKEKEALWLRCDKAFHEAYEAFNRSQAGLLASELKENEPCPVCGSIHHPHPATIVAGSIDKEKLDELEKERNEAQGEYSEATSYLGSKNSELSIQVASLIKDLSSLTGRIIEEKDLKMVLDEEKFQVEKKLDEIIKEINAYEALERQRKLDIENLAKNRRELTSYEEAEKDADKKEKEASNLFNQENGKLSELKRNVEGKTVEQVRDVLVTNSNKIKLDQEELQKLQKSLKDEEQKLEGILGKIDSLNNRLPDDRSAVERNKINAEKSLKEKGFSSFEEAENVRNNASSIPEYIRKTDEYDLSINKLKGVIESNLKDGFDKIVIVDDSNFDSDLGAVKEEYEKINEDYSQLKNTIFNNKRTYKDVASKYADIEVKDKEYREIRKLADTASGTLPGRSKIDFEVYYQAQIFDEILEIASRKFNGMSSGRYTLSRKKDGFKGNAKAGLEIDVTDYHTGKERSANTLSGG